MFAFNNGIAAYGAGLIPFSATFLNFITYGFPAVRLAALSDFQQIFIMTHDSIGLGEDGPTHQPIEVLPLLRATPNLLLLRPADGNETSGAYYAALTNFHGPSVICLSRQKLPQLSGSSSEKSLKGAYIIHTETSKLKLILVSTGSEVDICVKVAQKNPSIRVVSFPSWSLFEKQSEDYKMSVFPSEVPVVSVEAASTFGWSKYAKESIGVDSFGKSGPYDKVYEEFGLFPQAVEDKISKYLQ
jgi:transketolase